MSEILDGGPAFPSETYVPALASTAPGMSLRDWFAGQALPSLLVGSPDCTVDEIAHDAFRLADAMLAERGRS